jgi:hypothetical protein
MGYAMTQLRWLVAAFSPQWPGFSLTVVHVVSVVDKVSLGQVFLQALKIPLQIIISHIFHIHLSSVAGTGTIGPFAVAVPKDSS